MILCFDPLLLLVHVGELHVNADVHRVTQFFELLYDKAEPHGQAFRRNMGEVLMSFRGL